MRFTSIGKACKLSGEDQNVDTVYRCFAGSAFGMEGLVSKELKQLGAQEVAAQNGGVFFRADGEQLFLYNLRMRFSDRLYIVSFTTEHRKRKVVLIY